MNDLQRVLANTLIEFMVDRRLAGRPLTKTQRSDAVAIARELGLLPSPKRTN
jgi:hypothetical protein